MLCGVLCSVVCGVCSVCSVPCKNWQVRVVPLPLATGENSHNRWSGLLSALYHQHYHHWHPDFTTSWTLTFSHSSNILNGLCCLCFLKCMSPLKWGHQVKTWKGLYKLWRCALALNKILNWRIWSSVRQDYHCFWSSWSSFNSWLSVTAAGDA